MTHKDKVIDFLSNKSEVYCDDCISQLCGILPRQTVYQTCSKLLTEGKVQRNTGSCFNCGKSKTINSLMYDCKIVQKEINNKNAGFHNTIHGKNKITSKSMELDILDAEFVPVALIFEAFDIENTFAKFDAHTLKDTLDNNKYKKSQNEIIQRYFEFWDYPLGEFLLHMKTEGNTIYQRFLNIYGDESFCRFRMADSTIVKRKGLYIYKNNDCVKYIGRVKGEYDFNKRINWGYATISPKNCYLDGQATNCHINSIINSLKGDVELYLKVMDDDDQICRLEEQMIKKYQPEWNIALKT